MLPFTWWACCVQKEQYGLCSVLSGRDNWKTSYSLRRGHGLPFGDPTQAKGSDSWVAAHLARLGGTRLAGHCCHPSWGLCLIVGLGCVGLQVLGAGAAVPGPLSCLCLDLVLQTLVLCPAWAQRFCSCSQLPKTSGLSLKTLFLLMASA